jgi:hypothetical protein
MRGSRGWAGRGIDPWRDHRTPVPRDSRPARRAGPSGSATSGAIEPWAGFSSIADPCRMYQPRSPVDKWPISVGRTQSDVRSSTPAPDSFIGPASWSSSRSRSSSRSSKGPNSSRRRFTRKRGRTAVGSCPRLRRPQRKGSRSPRAGRKAFERETGHEPATLGSGIRKKAQE